jgi:hypothetical protein
MQMKERRLIALPLFLVISCSGVSRPPTVPGNAAPAPGGPPTPRDTPGRPGPAVAEIGTINDPLALPTLFSTNYASAAPPLAHWMQTYGCAIENKLLTAVLYPASHDAGTGTIDPSSILIKDPYLSNVLQGVLTYFNQGPSVMAGWAQTQGITIGEQLNAGARYFDMRLSSTVTSGWPISSWSTPAQPFYLVHALSGENVQDTYPDIASFLLTNTQEIVFLDFTFLNMTAELHQQHLAMLTSALGNWMVPSSGTPATDLQLTVSDLWDASDYPDWIDDYISDNPGYVAPRVIVFWSGDRPGSLGISYDSPLTWKNNDFQYVYPVLDCQIAGCPVTTPQAAQQLVTAGLPPGTYRPEGIG